MLLGDVVQYQSRAPHASKMSVQSGFALNDKISDVRSTCVASPITLFSPQPRSTS